MVDRYSSVEEAVEMTVAAVVVEVAGAEIAQMLKTVAQLVQVCVAHMTPM